MRGLCLFFVAFLLLMAGVTACSDINCSSSSSSYANYLFKDRNDSTLRFIDTLTVFTKTLGKRDTVLMNRLVGDTAMALPVSSSLSADTLYFFYFWRQANPKEAFDTVVIQHTNIPHFSSPECGISVTHAVSDIQYTKHFIEEIQILNKNVSANTAYNFKVRFNTLATDTIWR